VIDALWHYQPVPAAFFSAFQYVFPEVFLAYLGE
jgi:hypothetical protein